MIPGLPQLAATAAAVGGDLIGSERQREFNAEQAAKNRKFQKRASNTAYRRAAKDLEAAGLNRVIALGNPASTPTGATASMEAPKLGTTGIQAASAKQAIATQKADESLKRMTTDVQAEEKRLKAANASKAEVEKKLYEKALPIVEDALKDFPTSVGGIMEELNPLSDISRRAGRGVFDFLENIGVTGYQPVDNNPGTGSKGGGRKSGPEIRFYNKDGSPMRGQK